jgi:hypothetical protein
MPKDRGTLRQLDTAALYFEDDAPMIWAQCRRFAAELTVKRHKVTPEELVESVVVVMDQLGVKPRRNRLFHNFLSTYESRRVDPWYDEKLGGMRPASHVEATYRLIEQKKFGND